MNCPVCGKKMEEGICHVYDGRGGRRLAWMPCELQKKSRFVVMTKGRIEQGGGVVTPVHSTIFDNEEQISWCCKDCGKIVIDVR